MRNAVLITLVVVAGLCGIAGLPWITPTWLSVKWLFGVFTADVIAMLGIAKFWKQDAAP